MAQINLLKQPSVSHTQVTSSIVEVVLLFVLFGIVGYYGWLYFQSNQIDSDMLSTQKTMAQQTQQAMTDPHREELITRQEQLTNLASLISSHQYWSQILPEIAQVTLKTATYSDLQIASNGTLSLTASVPTLDDLDTYLQVFDLPSVYKYFSNVTISSFGVVQNLNSTSVHFQVTMNYNPALANYIPPATGR